MGFQVMIPLQENLSKPIPYIFGAYSFGNILSSYQRISNLSMELSELKFKIAADRKANIATYGGRVMARPDKVTPAGIRQEFPIHTKPRHLKWHRQSVKGLTYIVTDRGPMRAWQKVIGRREDNLCDCGRIQNAVHLLCCPLIGDGKGRTLEECMEDSEWCRKVADFLA